MNTDDLAWLRTCGAAGIEKEGGTCGVEGARKNGMTSGVVHQRSSHFSGPLLRSQFLPSFSMPAAPQVRSHARSDGGDGGKASGSARRRIGVSMWGWEDGWKGVWIRQEGGSV